MAGSHFHEKGRHFPRETRKVRTKKIRHMSRLSFILCIALAIVITIGARFYLFDIVRVDGNSMHPTLNSFQRITIEKISRYFSLPQRQDVVIVKHLNSNDYLVKRVIGLPHEVLEIKNNVVYINGVPLDEPYISKEPYMDMPPTKVPPNSVFVMGDNRADSTDSRAQIIGAIPHKNIIGNAIGVVWPLNQIHMI